jgi:hypothetical protein
MAKKATITPVTDTVNNASAINTQLNAINNQLDNTLSLDGSTPNAMNADIDLNNNDILNAKNIYSDEVTVGGIPLASNVAAAAASATSASLSAAAAAQSVDEARLIAFGAVGDGITDDTAAVVAAVNSGLPLQWDDLTYRITSPLIATVSKLDWTGSGAVILYDGAYAREAVKITCAISQDHRVHGITFDANSLANVAGKFVAATVAETIDLWPNFYATDIVARNAYRADLTFLDGDGFRVDGGFNRGEIDGIRVHDCYMAVGADVFGSQGIFGLTFASNGSRRCRRVRVANYHIENVWSEDATVFADQDAVRIFQETAESTSSCYILQGTVKNVANRAIKLHSAVNAVVDGLYRELDSTVIPQSGEFSFPDIDSQQCPATITNCRFHYDGAWHSALVQNYTERAALYRYGGSIVNNISALILNAGGNAITAVVLSGETGISATKHVAAVSNIAIDGPIETILSILIRGASGSNDVTLVNAVAQVTGQAVESLSESARLRVSATNLHNTASGSPVPLGANFDSGDRELSVVGYYGFTNVGATLSMGGDSQALVLNELNVSTDMKGPDPEPNRIGPTFVGFGVVSDAGVSDTDVILLLQPYADTPGHTSGTFYGYRGTATSAGVFTVEVAVMKDASSGDSSGSVVVNGVSDKIASLITCTFGGIQRIGVRINGAGAGSATAKMFFHGNYEGSQPTRLVPASAVTSIAAFVQRTGYETATSFLQPVRLPSYTVATLPTAGDFASCLIWVTNETGGSTMATSDGTNWRRMSNGAIVS